MFGRRILRLGEVESTNDEAFEIAADGAAEGTAVVADVQWQGRGRQGRTWHSPPGLNLYCSVVLRPRRKRHEWLDLPWVVASAAGGALREMGVGNLTVKCPNDLLAGGKKIGGILLENRQCGSRATAVVAGLGLNVNMTKKDFPPELAGRVTSLREITGGIADRDLLLKRFLRQLETCYGLWSSAGPAAVRKAAEEQGMVFTGFDQEGAVPEGSG